MKTPRIPSLLFCFAVAAGAHAGMIGDPVTSILHTAFSGSWTAPSATNGPGAEFTQTYYAGNTNIVIQLDISDTSFTLIYSNNIIPTLENNGGFNLGLYGFEFTDLNQQFSSVTLAGTTGGFPTGSITNTLVTPTNIRIFMNGPTIPGATTWTATWNVTLAPKLSIMLTGGNAVLSWPADAAGYTLQRQSNIASNAWVNVVTNTTQIALPATNSAQFFRLLKY